LTLTAASNVVFLELGWNPAQHSQAGDRCHRIGQTDSVTEWWFIARDTIESDIQQLIEKKRVVVDAATDGIEHSQGTSIMNELIDRLVGPNRTVVEIQEDIFSGW
jgi:SWI/SNF-related matrix-associated actin-dependent regulator of chromatin subfamily A-like protein 1